MHNEVELCDIIRASVLASLDTALEDGYSYVHLDTVSLLDRLADQFEGRRLIETGLRIMRTGSNETGEKGGDEFYMDID
jgi:hypothetical protein